MSVTSCCCLLQLEKVVWTVESETVRGQDDTGARITVTQGTMRAPLVTTVTLVSLVTAQTIPQQMTIAAVFDEGGDRKHELAFRHAVRSINRNKYDNISCYSFDPVMPTDTIVYCEYSWPTLASDSWTPVRTGDN